MARALVWLLPLRIPLHISTCPRRGGGESGIGQSPPLRHLAKQGTTQTATAHNPHSPQVAAVKDVLQNEATVVSRGKREAEDDLNHATAGRLCPPPPGVWVADR